MIAKDPVRQMIVELLERTLPAGLPANGPAEKALVDARLDSVAVLHLVSALEERLACSLPETDLSAENFATVGSLVRLVHRRIAP